jgi:hypothetical protein
MFEVAFLAMAEVVVADALAMADVMTLASGCRWMPTMAPSATRRIWTASNGALK